jgi:hypothetical protein
MDRAQEFYSAIRLFRFLTPRWCGTVMTIEFDLTVLRWPSCKHFCSGCQLPLPWGLKVNRDFLPNPGKAALFDPLDCSAARRQNKKMHFRFLKLAGG